MIKMLQQAITNTLETKENLENLNEIECLQRKRMYTEPNGNDRMYCDYTFHYFKWTTGWAKAYI